MKNLVYQWIQSLQLWDPVVAQVEKWQLGQSSSSKHLQPASNLVVSQHQLSSHIQTNTNKQTHQPVINHVVKPKRERKEERQTFFRCGSTGKLSKDCSPRPMSDNVLRLTNLPSRPTMWGALMPSTVSSSSSAGSRPRSCLDTTASIMVLISTCKESPHKKKKGKLRGVLTRSKGFLTGQSKGRWRAKGVWGFPRSWPSQIWVHVVWTVKKKKEKKKRNWKERDVPANQNGERMARSNEGKTFLQRSFRAKREWKKKNLKKK